MVILFRIRKYGPSQLATIYCRITINYVRLKTDFSTGIKIDPKKWDAKAQRIKGQAGAADNERLRLMEHELKSIFNSLIAKGEVVTAEKVKHAYIHKEKPEPTLVCALDEFLEEKKAEVGIKIKEASYINYRTRIRFFQKFLAERKLTHLMISELDYRVVDQFIGWASLKEQVGDSWIAKMIAMLKQVITLNIRAEVLQVNKLTGVSHRKTPASYPEYLRRDQLAVLEVYRYEEEYLQRVSDAALFQAYSSFDYADMATFDPAKHLKADGSSGWVFLEKAREKRPLKTTGMVMLVPVLPPLQRLLTKYRNQTPLHYPDGKVLSYDQYRRGLKILAHIHTFHLNLKSKTLRKTFAMLMTDSGVSLQAISKMMGHNSYRTTETVYAKVEAARIIREIDSVFQQK